MLLKENLTVTGCELSSKKCSIAVLAVDLLFLPESYQQRVLSSFKETVSVLLGKEPKTQLQN